MNCDDSHSFLLVSICILTAIYCVLQIYMRHSTQNSYSFLQPIVCAFNTHVGSILVSYCLIDRTLGYIFVSPVASLVLS